MDDDPIKGKLKQGDGRLTGDADREAEGKAQESWGKTKDKADDAFDETKDSLEDAKDKIT